MLGSVFLFKICCEITTKKGFDILLLCTAVGPGGMVRSEEHGAAKFGANSQPLLQRSMSLQQHQQSNMLAQVRSAYLFFVLLFDLIFSNYSSPFFCDLTPLIEQIFNNDLTLLIVPLL